MPYSSASKAKHPMHRKIKLNSQGKVQQVRVGSLKEMLVSLPASSGIHQRELQAATQQIVQDLFASFLRHSPT
jgi:hypothetical protein